MNSVFAKLPIKGKKTYYVLTELKNEGKDGFDLLLTDGEKCWNGLITEEDLNAFSSSLKTDFDSYVTDTKRALTRQNISSTNFVYEILPQAEDSVEFIWKKELDGDIRILLGRVLLTLSSDSAKSLDHIFTICIANAADSQRKMQSLEADNHRLSQDLKNAAKKLEKLIIAKEEYERDLFSKFVLVLNSKKEKIRSLQQGDSLAHTSGENNGARVRKLAAGNSDPNYSETDENERAHSTREEGANSGEESPPKKARGSITWDAKEDADSSLVLGDEKADNNQKKGDGIIRRPARQREGNKQQTPSRPVLPKVLSRPVETRSRSSSRNSLRKSGSGNSERSFDSLDTDDLLKDF